MRRSASLLAAGTLAAGLASGAGAGSAGRPPLRLGSLDAVLAVIPHLLGFTPDHCLVVLGIASEGRIKVAFRYDLPDPPDAGTVAAIADHAASVLAREHLGTMVAVGYGPGRLVTPLADALRAAAPRAAVRLHDVVRVQDGRYWSYQCTEPSCCPPEGTPFDPDAHPTAAVLAKAGLPVAASREAVAAAIAPFTGPQAEAMAEAFKTGASYYAVTEYRAIVDCSGKQPQFKKEVVKRNH